MSSTTWCTTWSTSRRRPCRPSGVTDRVAGNGDAPAQDEPEGYEQARDELLEVVRRLEAGGTTLEEALALWERGERLAAVCQQWLDGARRRLDAASPEPA